MDGEVGYIYIREHEAYNNYAVCKLGKTECIPERENTYITGEIVKGVFTLVFEVKKDQLDLIEKVLQENFKNINVYINGGTEFFKLEIKELIEPYFKEKNIYYKLLSQENINNLKRKYREKKQKESGIQEPYNTEQEDNIKYLQQLSILEPQNMAKYNEYLQQVKTTSLKLLKLKDIPKEFMTFELCIEAIKKLEYYDDMPFIRLLKFIPDNIKNYIFWLECVKFNGECLRKVPEKFKIFELCVEAIKNLKPNCYGVMPHMFMFGLLKFIPNNVKNYNFWLECVINGMFLREVPEEHKTCELCVEAIKNSELYNFDVDWLFEFIPDNIKNYNFWLECVKIKGLYLYKVSENLIDYNLIFIAFKTDGIQLDYKIENFKSLELCVDAIKNDMNYLHFLSDKILNYNFCLKAVKDNCGLEGVPKKFVTQELCLEAVKAYGFDIEYVPEELLTLELCLIAIKNNCETLKIIPEKFKTHELCFEAVKIGGEYALKCLPVQFKTKKFYGKCIEHDSKLAQYVPKKFKIK